MTKMQEKQEVEQIQGFTSTAYKTQKQFGSVQVVYKNVQGVNVAALSEFPSEKEYLIPPSTQIKYTGHKVVDGRHVFTAEGTNILLDTKKELSPTERTDLAIDKLVEKTIKHLGADGRISDQEAKEFFKEVIDLNVKNGLVSEKEKELYFKSSKLGK
jgi:hypothetical protein